MPEILLDPGLDACGKRGLIGWVSTENDIPALQIGLNVPKSQA
nr:hypothetical protein [Rhodoferax sp.]